MAAIPQSTSGIRGCKRRQYAWERMKAVLPRISNICTAEVRLSNFPCP